jgi:hypothetical protein
MTSARTYNGVGYPLFWQQQNGWRLSQHGRGGFREGHGSTLREKNLAREEMRGFVEIRIIMADAP